MATIRIPTPLRPYTGGNEHIRVTGHTVGEVLADLTGQYPELEPHIVRNGELRSFVNVFLGEENIRSLDGIHTAIGEDDRLLIIPSIAGGTAGMRG